MLTLKNVNKTYRGPVDFHALKNINLSIARGEFVAILGESGSGKSTLLNVISGLDRIDSGEIVIDGVSTRDFTAKDYAVYRNYLIGFVFQEFNLIQHLNIVENVELPLLLQGMKKAEARKKAIEQLEIVGLKKHLLKRPGEISGGQQQRVSIARSLVTDPVIVMADEPTGALDTETSEIIMRILKTLAKEKIVILVTHEEEIAQTYATRIIELSDGVVVSDSAPRNEDSSSDQNQLRQKRPRMNLSMAAKFAMNNLRTRALRTLFTSLTMSIGMITFFLLSFMLFGLENNIIRSISNIVPPNEYEVIGEQELTEFTKTEISQIDGVDELFELIVVDNASVKRLVSGDFDTTVANLPKERVNFSLKGYLVGGYPDGLDEIILSSGLVNKFYATVGTLPTAELYNRIKENPFLEIKLKGQPVYNPITDEYTYRESEAKTYKVVGVFEGAGSIVFTRTDDLKAHIAIQDDYPDPGVYKTYIYMEDDSPQTVARVRTALEEDHGLFLYNMFSETVKNIREFLSIGQTILTVISSLSLVVSGILIGLIMYISVIERTKEIGILNALGARKANIQGLFVFESGLIGAVSTMIAFAISFVIGQFVNRAFSSGLGGMVSQLAGLETQNMKIIQVNLLIVGAIFLVAIVYSVICGFVPALRASNMKAIDALRNE